MGCAGGEIAKKCPRFKYNFSIRNRKKTSLTPLYPTYIKMLGYTSILGRNIPLSSVRIRETMGINKKAQIWSFSDLNG